MLRIVESSSSSQAKSYYKAADYYIEGQDQELTGQWRGRAAARLGLSADVDAQSWSRLCDNLHPETGKKLTPRLEVTTADSSALRGDMVHIEGRVTANGTAIADHPIDVFLAPAGRGGADPIPLGRTVSDKTGGFRQDFTLPGSLNLATYEIYLASPEDSYYNASLSN